MADKISLRATGFDAVMKSLRKDLKKAGADLTYRGLLRVGLLILRDAQKYAPRDTGNLMGSGFVLGQPSRGESKIQIRPSAKKSEEEAAISQSVEEGRGELMLNKPPSVMVGFGASYALFVHEADEDQDWHDGGPQFLKKSVEDNHAKAVALITEEVRKL